MWRGTTPTHTFTLPEGIRVQDFTVIYITYSQNGSPVLEKEKADMTLEGNVIRLTFSQADSLLFDAGPVKIQLRAKTADGKAVASEIVTTTAKEVLKDGEI